MKRSLLTFVLLALLALPMMVSAREEAGTPPEVKSTSKPPASQPVGNGQKRVESTSQATDAARPRQGADALEQSRIQYNLVNPTARD